ncbi:hypothetical protein [Aliivibrio sp. SR45-2]|uniref:hypothetical protein n=1 Tax=Aliivibrio sp. SR45-2 TaxID=2760931 RepID=UPI0015F7DDE5|nr:hypothetical protein [Aliivibrio sp. SR45-2]MBB1313401.1 hypothetical protein [Aliivibrio sp. SR45-2]
MRLLLLFFGLLITFNASSMINKSIPFQKTIRQVCGATFYDGNEAVLGFLDIPGESLKFKVENNSGKYPKINFRINTVCMNYPVNYGGELCGSYRLDSFIFHLKPLSLDIDGDDTNYYTIPLGDNEVSLTMQYNAEDLMVSKPEVDLTVGIECD